MRVDEGSSPAASTLPSTGDSGSGQAVRSWRSPKVRLALVLALSILVASVADHAIAAWINLQKFSPTYRRIGPEERPQIFAAGSSLLQFGLQWPDVASFLGQGLENWGVPASSPEMWERAQPVAPETNLMLIGVSVYDLNEYRVAEGRANLVPIVQTLRDLRESNSDWSLSQRLLSQYLLKYARLLFPTAAFTDKVHVGLRAKARVLLGRPAAKEDLENELVLPSKPILQFGDSTLKVSNWDDARMLRRMALLRLENEGRHAFDGPKRLAFRRMLTKAGMQGGVIVVILPVTDAYAAEFLTPDVTREFEAAVADARRLVPDAIIVRLDREPGLSSNQYFSDLVHLNSAGRRIATDAFLRQLRDSAHHSQ